MTSVYERISAMTGEQRGTLDDRFSKASRLARAEPVAVVGLGCRLPGDVHGPDSFWQLLVDGRDAITEVPADRWDIDAYYDADATTPGKMNTRWGGFLSDMRGFDADFFGITPREAEAMDPQQRLLLEVTWEALEHAGIRPDALSESRTAVMMGVYYNEYQAASVADSEVISPYWATGNAHSVTVGRIAYLLGLRGPAMAFDTACSSSLVAIHEACQSLRMRESDMALAGGVSLILRPETQLALSAWGMFSPHGKCRSFDAGADGFVRGEGCGVVVLKRLTDAVRDGDRVLAVVRGSAVNQDGRSNGLTAPNAGSQRDVIAAALHAADVTAESVTYVETHGTATRLGDPIEFEALAQTYGRGTGDCALGAVKTNIGHLEAAAGVVGFIKATLALRHAHIPPNLNFIDWNPGIDPAGTRLFVPTANMAWPGAGPRRAAVSSFGFGGTNAHFVLEQGPDPATGPAGQMPSAVTTLTVSAKTPDRLADWAGVLADWIGGPGAAVPLTDVAATLAHHRTRYPLVATVSAGDHTQAADGLRALALGQPAPGVVEPHQHSGARGTVFVYSGQGSQWTGMCRGLLTDEPAFAAAVDELEPDFVAQTGFSLRDVLSSGEPVTGIARVQPVLVGVQLALTRLWRSYGIEPDAVIGHSMGEVTAAVVAGALSVADGLRVIATRSRLMSRLSGQGAMALLELDAEATTALLAEYPDVTLAVYAAPRQTVVAGPVEQVQAVIDAVHAQNRLARPIEVDVASHHPLIDPVLPELRTLLADIAPRQPSIPILSTAREHDRGPAFDADYWCDNLRNPVRFHQAIAAAAQHHGCLVEVSPHPVLLHAVNDTLDYLGATDRVQVLPTLNRGNPESLFFHTQVASLAPANDVPAVAALADIPTTPWRHAHFWVAGASGQALPRGTHPLLGTHVELPNGAGHVWQGDVGTARNRWLADHKVHGQPILPGPAFAEIVLAAACEALGLSPAAVDVRHLEIEQMLPLSELTPITTQLSAGTGDAPRVEVHSRTDNGIWLRHAVARVEEVDPATVDRTPLTPAVLADSLSIADYYAALRHSGQQHGPAFAGLTRIARLAAGGSETAIALPEETPRNPAYRIHPVLLDAAMQGLAAALPADLIADRADATYLPVSFESIRVFGEVGPTAICRAELTSLDDGGAGMLGRVRIFDDAGNPTAEITGVYVRRVERRTVPLPLSQRLFGTTWVQRAAADAPPAPVEPGSWLVLADSGMTPMAEDLAAEFGALSRRVFIADLHDESAVLRAFAETAADPALPPRGVVVFVGGTSPDPVGVEALTHTRDTVWSVAAAVRAVARGWHGQSPRLWLVTSGGLVVADSEAGNPAAGALRGLVRVLTHEHPELHATLVDIETRGDGLATLVTELQLTDRDDVVAWRSGRRYVERLSRTAIGAPQYDHVVRPDGSYVLTGGLGGLGLVMARWLVDRGAGRVVLNGRSAPTPSAQAVLDELGERSQIEVVTGDIATPGVAEALVDSAEATGLPLCGVIHSAAVIDDAILATMSKDSLERVWDAKAFGALRLHHATRGRNLDWWVGFSSMAALLGSPGQGAYAAANAWLDALAQWRHGAGLPATSVNWGQWADVGVAQGLTMGVLDPISPAEGVEALEALLAAGAVNAGVARLRLDRAAAAFPEIGDLGYFSELAEELDDREGAADWAGPQALAELDAAEAATVVADRLRMRLLAIMGYPEDWPLDATSPLIDLGMDSLMAVRIRNTARADFGVEPPVALLLQGASLRELTDDLIGQLGLAESAATERASGLGARARQRAMARQGAAMRRRKGDDG
ncbi:MAG: type I polyketide synthase [Mycobacterium sp.]